MSEPPIRPVASNAEIRIQFPGLTPGEATAIARELETLLRSDGAPAEDVRVARDNAEAMDFGATLLIGAGILGWEFLKGGAKAAGSEIGGAAARDLYEALRRKITAFCQHRRVAAEVAEPGGRVWMLGSEFDRSADAVPGPVLPGNIGTLGVVLLGASVFRHTQHGGQTPDSAYFASPPGPVPAGGMKISSPWSERHEGRATMQPGRGTT